MTKDAEEGREQTMIQVRDLHCGYNGREVLHGVGINVPKGQMAGILGPNGSGKTTLMHVLAGILAPTSGEAELDGTPVHNYSAKALARTLAVVPQHTRATFPYRCLNVVLMGRYPYVSFLGGYRQRDMDAALEAMRESKSLHLADRMADTLSGGEFKRVVISRALAQQSEILLLDEATAGLDVAAKIAMYDLFRRMAANGTTICSVMHDLNLAALYCDRLVFLKNGQVVADGPTKAIFNRQTLSDVYETEVVIADHPITGQPQAHFVPGQS
ncbi:MAG: ABC transporter ATP-binding protein [Desulfovibrio sp.]|uniref:ABC transporter ATP-binding protein n=1 Tax=Desulfovibrio sp. 7SRBS1 TaxID=3378064 RepID=UPI003B3E4CF4